MTGHEFRQEMQAILHDYSDDKEKQHGKADDLLERAMESLALSQPDTGYWMAGMDFYKEMEKWCA